MTKSKESIYKRKNGYPEERIINNEQEKCIPLQNVPPKTELFSKLLTEWLSTVQPHIRESSYNKYLNQINKNILPYLGGKYITEIDTFTLQRYISILSSGENYQQKALSSKTVQDTLSVIRRVFYYAGTKEYKLTCNFQNLYVPSVQCKLTVFSKNEQQRMISYLMRSNFLSDMGILLTLFTGLRIGEICALTWNKIDLNAGFLYVEHTMQRIQNLSNKEITKTKVIISKPKSISSIRSIPLPEFITSYLQTFRQSGNEFLLTGSSKRFMEPRALQYRFEKILSILKIRKLNFHALRHTFATHCVEAGFDVKCLSEILGHSNVNITLNRYVHPSDEAKLQNMNKLELFFNI